LFAQTDSGVVAGLTGSVSKTTYYNILCAEK